MFETDVYNCRGRTLSNDEGRIIRMSSKLQYIKYILCVILYLLICLFFLRLKSKLHLIKNGYTEQNNKMEQKNSLSDIKEMGPSSTTITYNKTSVNLNVQLLHNKLKCESSYQQVSILNVVYYC